VRQHVRSDAGAHLIFLIHNRVCTCDIELPTVHMVARSDSDEGFGRQSAHALHDEASGGGVG
jgi:hypothetical protein